MKKGIMVAVVLASAGAVGALVLMRRGGLLATGSTQPGVNMPGSRPLTTGNVVPPPVPPTAGAIPGTAFTAADLRAWTDAARDAGGMFSGWFSNAEVPAASASVPADPSYFWT